MIGGHEDGQPASSGDSALERLIPLVYPRLRELARRYLERESDCLTIQPTALVHEAYLRLTRIERMTWGGRTHVYAMAAREMRRVLVDRARAVSAQKRGGRP